MRLDKRDQEYVRSCLDAKRRPLALKVEFTRIRRDQLAGRWPGSRWLAEEEAQLEREQHELDRHDGIVKRLETALAEPEQLGLEV